MPQTYEQNRKHLGNTRKHMLFVQRIHTILHVNVFFPTYPWFWHAANIRKEIGCVVFSHACIYNDTGSCFLHMWLSTQRWFLNTYTCQFVRFHLKIYPMNVVILCVNSFYRTLTSVVVNGNVHFPALLVWIWHANICSFDVYMSFLWNKISVHVFFDVPRPFLTQI